jgi:hypothetical protein
MLTGIEHSNIAETLFRLTNPPRFKRAMMDLRATLQETIEVIDFLGADNLDDAKVMLDRPFEVSANWTPRPTRYSDGTWRVFYSALDPETAKAEVGYWAGRELLSEASEPRHFHYRIMRCQIDGHGFDIRSKLEEWPFLVGDEDQYPQCQSVAREAIDVGGDALICPSARRLGGTTVPVFVRSVISAPEIVGAVVLRVEPSGDYSVAYQEDQPEQ